MSGYCTDNSGMVEGTFWSILFVIIEKHGWELYFDLLKSSKYSKGPENPSPGSWFGKEKFPFIQIIWSISVAPSDNPSLTTNCVSLHESLCSSEGHTYVRWTPFNVSCFLYSVFLFLQIASGWALAKIFYFTFLKLFRAVGTFMFLWSYSKCSLKDRRRHAELETHRIFVVYCVLSSSRQCLWANWICSDVLT